MHIYEKDGGKYPSVTTIVHSLGSDELMKWANFLGFKHVNYEKELERTALFGTLVHSHLQSIVDPNDIEPIMPKNGMDAYDLDTTILKFNNYIKDFSYKTIFTEKTIISEDLGYAGTLDWLATINDKLVLVDFKTAKKPQMSMYFQLGGYYNLLNSIGYDPDLAAIMTVNVNGTKLHPINKDDLVFYSEVFNSLAAFYIKANYHTNPKPNIDYEIVNSLTTK